MKNRCIKLSAFLLAVGAQLAAASSLFAQIATPDFEREARWKSEVAAGLVVGDAIELKVATRDVFAIYAEGKKGFPAIVLIHGVGVHPDHGIIGVLRSRLNDLGYTTLSVQMPVLAKETTDPQQYFAVFPHATNRIIAAADFLKSKGFVEPHQRILLSHSMGSWMSNVFFETTPTAYFGSWVCLSITGRIGSTGDHRLPVLDVQGENDLEPVRRGSWLRGMKLLAHPGSKRVQIPSANHFFEGQESFLTTEIDSFIKNTNK
jgi:dienelactone hydrolase